MKISKNELDPTLNDKIDRLEKIVTNFVDDDKAGFVSFNGNEFYIKRMNDVSLRKIYSESSIGDLRSSLYNEKGLTKNSFRTNFNMDNKASSRFKTQVIMPKETVVYNSQTDIILHKRENDDLVFLTDAGFLIKFDLKKKQMIAGVDIVKELRTNFAIPKISPFDFLTLELYGSGVLVSTSYNGVLFYDFGKKTLEVKFPENGVVLIKNLYNGNILCGMDRVDSNVAFFNFESGMKIETSNIMKRKLFQVPILVDLYKDDLFVVGKPYGANTTQNILHYWKKDLAKLSFNNSDGEVFPGYDQYDHSIKHISITEEYLYISGLKSNNDLFIWQYDLKQLHKPYKEFIFDKFKFNKLSFVDFNEDYFIAGDGQSIYFLDARGNIEKNIKLSKEVNSVFLFEGSPEFLILTKNQIISVELPDYVEDEEIMMTVYKGESACNNIDIYIDSNNAREKFGFFNAETKEDVVPYFIATHKNKTIVKILGSSAKNIVMRLFIPTGTEIEGIVVNADRLFLK